MFITINKHHSTMFFEWDEEIEVKNDYLVKSFIVSSFRLDKIISSFYKISRQKAAEFIRAGHVKVNHKPLSFSTISPNNSLLIPKDIKAPKISRCVNFSKFFA